VADDKSGIAGGEAGAANAMGGDDQRPVGQLLVEARTRRGLSAEDVTAQTRIPPLYLKAIETDNYGLISDQLYLLPFLRRYASFVGLDPEDVASRFVHDVQRAETSVTRMSEPITMVSRKRNPLRYVALGVVLAAAVAVLILFAMQKFGMLRSVAIPGLGSSNASHVASARQSASGVPATAPSNLPFATTIKPAAAAGADLPTPPQAGANAQSPPRASD
jgi:cytoskeletal protein RodZ